MDDMACICGASIGRFIQSVLPAMAANSFAVVMDQIWQSTHRDLRNENLRQVHVVAEQQIVKEGEIRTVRYVHLDKLTLRSRSSTFVALPLS